MSQTASSQPHREAAAKRGKRNPDALTSLITAGVAAAVAAGQPKAKKAKASKVSPTMKSVLDREQASIDNEIAKAEPATVLNLATGRIERGSRAVGKLVAQTGKAKVTVKPKPKTTAKVKVAKPVGTSRRREQALAYIRKHHGEPFTGSSLAKALGCPHTSDFIGQCLLQFAADNIGVHQVSDKPRRFVADEVVNAK